MGGALALFPVQPTWRDEAYIDELLSNYGMEDSTLNGIDISDAISNLLHKMMKENLLENQNG